MAMTGSFEVAGRQPIRFGDITGYRIAAGFKLGQGFDNGFFVYVRERVLGAGKLAALEIPNRASDFRGKLTLSDADRDYEFKNLDLLSIEPGATRKERYRILEFRYDKAVSDQGIDCTLNFKKTVTVQEGELGDDFTFAIGAGRQQLLGFRARQSASDAVVFRFSSLRSRDQSWLTMLLDKTDDGKEPNPQFKIGFSQGDLEIDSNTSFILIEESWSDGNVWPQKDPGDLSLTAAERARLGRITLPDYAPESLSLFDAATGGSRTIDTATFVFNPKRYHNLKIT